jgi:hypothetical protein
MRYRYCNKHEKYRTVAKQSKSRHIDTSYSTKLCKEWGTGTVISEKVPDRNENSLKRGTMIPAQFSSVIPLRSEPYRFLQFKLGARIDTFRVVNVLYEKWYCCTAKGLRTVPTIRYRYISVRYRFVGLADCTECCFKQESLKNDTGILSEPDYRYRHENKARTAFKLRIKHTVGSLLNGDC